MRALSRPSAALPPRALPPRPGQRQAAGGHRHVPRRVPRLPAPPRRPRRHPARARRRAQPPRGGRPPARGDEHRARRRRARHRQRRGGGRGRPAHRVASAHGHRIERAALRVRAPVHQPRPAGDARRHAPEHAGPADDLRRAGLRQRDARALHSGKLHQRAAAARGQRAALPPLLPDAPADAAPASAGKPRRARRAAHSRLVQPRAQRALCREAPRLF